MFHWIYAANAQHSEKICNFEGFCLGNVHILLYIFCHHLRIYVSWRVFVGPSGPGLGNVLGDEFVLKVACPQCRLSSTLSVLNVAVLNIVSSTSSVLNVP